MSREEEIKQAAKNRADQYEHPVDWNNCYHHYIQGAEWADQHPRKGLWDSEKVIKFIKEELPYYVELNCVFDEIQVNYNKFKNNFIHDLKKAMEE